MKKRQKKLAYLFSGTILLILILFTIFQITKLPGTAIPSDPNFENFTICLNEKNVKMYGSTKDINTLAQKQMFEESFKNINYIDCMDHKVQCSEILIFPSWKIDDKIIHGAISIEVLSKLTECNL